MSVRWRVLMGVFVCVMLVTGLLSPLQGSRVTDGVQASYSTPESAKAELPLRLAAGTFDPLQATAPQGTSQALQFADDPGEGDGYYLVQFQGPIHTAEVDALRAAGADVFDYVPDFAFIVKMDDTTRVAVERMAPVRWVGVYQPAYRLSPPLLARTVAHINAGPSAPPDDEVLTLVVSIFRGETAVPIVAHIQSWSGVILNQSQTEWQSKLKVTLPAATLADVAALPGVRWIEPAPQWRLYNDKADNVMGVREVWDTQGLYGAGQVVGVCDSGLDQGSIAPASLHDDFEDGSGNSRVLEIFDLVGDGASDVNSGHGTHVAGSVLGNGAHSGASPSTRTYPEDAYVGMAPEASLVFQAVEHNVEEDLRGIPWDLNDLFAPAKDAGVHLHTNSWGADVEGLYTTDSEAVDQYMWNNKDFTILFAAGNAGIDANADGVVDLYSMGSPATAKNCISVGASENNRPDIEVTWGGAWPSDYPVNPIFSDKIADNIAGLAAFSSRGPAHSHRYKPDIVAPGTAIISARSSMVSGSGHYMYMSGTSMATPLTAGAAAIVRQYFTDLESHTPSSALIKATLLNGATDIYPGQYGTGVGQEIPTTRPTNVAGWGRVNLENSIFPAGARALTYVDQTVGLSTGATVVYNYQIASSAEPFRVTLTWTDHPGSPVANGALVNDLDLTVIGPSGTTYYPNNALSSNGMASSTYDRVNNVEGIDIANPAAGLYTVTVSAHNVPQGPQPYALVASGVFTTVNTPPTLAGLPDQALQPGASKNSAIDLWAYASDDQDADTDLTFTITNSPPPTVGVEIRADRYIDINPTDSFTGTFPVVVEVMDTGGLTDTDSFSITFAEIPNTPPTLSGLPDQTLEPGASKNNAIDLWAYAFDAEDANTDLTFTITNSPPPAVGVTIDSNRYIGINPTASFTGTFPVVVEVMDTGGLTDTGSFLITFAELDTQYVYLPLVLSCYPILPTLLPISNPDGDGLYTIQWAMPACSSTTPSQYELQGATNPQFSDAQSEMTAGTSMNIYSPDPATYYWRVRAYLNGQWTSWSNVRSVNVGAFSYVFVQNDTGGSLTIEIVGIERRSFPAAFYNYWRSVPVGSRTVNVWANCGSLLGRSVNFTLGDFLMRYYCSYQAVSVAPDAGTTGMPDVDFVFEAIMP